MIDQKHQFENTQLPEEEGVDIKKYFFLILKHWWWFAITLFISVTIAYMVNRYSQEVFSNSCTLIIGEPETRAGTVESMLDELSRIRGKKRKAVVENEISILKSHKMSRLALEELDFDIEYVGVGRRGIAETRLYNKCPFIVKLDSSTPTQKGYPITILILNKDKYKLVMEEPFNLDTTLQFGSKFCFKSFNFTIELRNKELFQENEWTNNKIYFRVFDLNNLANSYSKNIFVEVNAEKGSILTLSSKGYVKEQIANYLNKLTEVYIRSNLNEKNKTSENTIEFIDNQLNGIIDSLQVTGKRLQSFRSTNKVINLSQEGTFLFEKMQDMQSEKAALDINSRYYSYLLEYIDERKDYSDVIAPSVIGIQDHLLSTLVAQLNELNLERRNLNLSVVENSPQVSLINNQILNTRDALYENLKSLVEGNKISMAELDQRIAEIEVEVQKLPGTERQLIDIEREFAINDQIYTFLLEKRAEAGITLASNISDHKMLDVSRPGNAVSIKPSTRKNYFFAIFVGVGLPFLIIIIIDILNTKIIDRKYLEAHLRVPVVGNIGHNFEGTELPVNENPRSSLSESFRSLRTNLQYILSKPEDKVIAISSAVSGEGKTFTSVNLACILAMTGKKTLIVNLDLRRPKVHKVFNLENKEGVSTYLIGMNSFDEVLSESNIQNLTVVTSGPIPPNPSELISSNKMKEFIKKSREEFDVVILDTPPIGIVSDCLSIQEVIDSFLYVIRHSYSDKQVIKLINDVSEKQIVRNAGIVVNDIQAKGYEGYSYKYGYTYNYSNNYYENEYKQESIINKVKDIIFNKK